MPEFHAVVTVTLKAEILDPAGEAVKGVLQHMEFPVSDIRIGRHIQVTVDAPDADEATRLVQQMAEEVLANPVMEKAHVRVEL